MSLSVGIHSKSTVPSPMISVRDAMKRADCVPSETCAETCKDLGVFVNSTMSASATGFLTPKFERTRDCEGSKKNWIGRVVCGADL